MEEHKGATTFQGKPLTLVGKPLKKGDKLPEVELLNQDLQTVNLSSYLGKICIISSVPSLDTPVCDAETRHFNELANQLGSDIAILTVSMDLPFAQKRWCGAANINNIKTFSDHRNAAFGLAFGVLIKELRLLSRAVFITDKQGTIQYLQYVKEMTEQPNYDEVLKAIKSLLQTPASLSA